MIFAGNLQGFTQTMPLVIFNGFETNLGVALSLWLILIMISAVILLALRTLEKNANLNVDRSPRVGKFTFGLTPGNLTTGVRALRQGIFLCLNARTRSAMISPTSSIPTDSHANPAPRPSSEFEPGNILSP